MVSRRRKRRGTTHDTLVIRALVLFSIGKGQTARFVPRTFQQIPTQLNVRSCDVFQDLAGSNFVYGSYPLLNSSLRDTHADTVAYKRKPIQFNKKPNRQTFSRPMAEHDSIRVQDGRSLQKLR